MQVKELGPYNYLWVIIIKFKKRSYFIWYKKEKIIRITKRKNKIDIIRDFK